MSTPDRKALEDAWRNRLQEAKQKVDAARNRVNEMKEEALSIPAPDSGYSVRQAMQAENLALKEYRRVLTVYRELAVSGVIPQEVDTDVREPYKRHSDTPSPTPALPSLQEQIRGLMKRILELTCEQIDAAGDLQKISSLEAELEDLRAQRDMLTRLYLRQRK
jgi:hypothetical protein